MTARIVKNRVEGTRITVWDITHYLEGNFSHEEILECLPITLEQLGAAVDYIDENREEVMRVHAEIERRIAKGNPPEVEAKRAETRQKMQLWLQARGAGRLYIP
ncbi:MAG: DUF433 domain-containing protein [Planctomycetota bacterium]|nr:DUF433 domain-containing protein [Planctomycetota bacterium]